MVELLGFEGFRVLFLVGVRLWVWDFAGVGLRAVWSGWGLELIVSGFALVLRGYRAPGLRTRSSAGCLALLAADAQP